MINKTTVLAKAPLYLIGNTLYKTKIDETNTIKTGRNSFTTVSLQTGYGNHYLIESTKPIRILNLETLFAQYTHMLQVCIYKKGSLVQAKFLFSECFNYSKSSVK